MIKSWHAIRGKYESVPTRIFAKRYCADFKQWISTKGYYQNKTKYGCSVLYFEDRFRIPRFPDKFLFIGPYLWNVWQWVRIRNEEVHHSLSSRLCTFFGLSRDETVLYDSRIPRSGSASESTSVYWLYCSTISSQQQQSGMLKCLQFTLSCTDDLPEIHSG